MIPLSENPAILDPRTVLTAPQQDALVSVAFYRHQVWRAGFIQVGKKRFRKATIDALKEMELLRPDRFGLAVTTGGQIAIERLKGGAK
jgi:hypothetical protein